MCLINDLDVDFTPQEVNIALHSVAAVENHTLQRRWGVAIYSKLPPPSQLANELFREASRSTESFEIAHHNMQLAQVRKGRDQGRRALGPAPARDDFRDPKSGEMCDPRPAGEIPSGSSVCTAACRTGRCLAGVS